jgi:hypothetical protein
VDKVYIKDHSRVKVKSIRPPAAVTPVVAHHGFSYAFLALTILVALLGIFAEGHFKQYIHVEAYCISLDRFLISHGIISKMGVSLDAFMAVITWSITYLFIRRLWNPETTDIAIRKFSPDAFFGGIAAGASVILKSMLVKILLEKQ